MAELKTKPNDRDVEAFLAGVEPEAKRTDARRLLELFQAATGERPVMWGDAIVGFGSYDYHYESGRKGTWFRVGFSPRKQNLTIYLMDGFDTYADQLDRLGPHKLGKSCLYVTRLERVDEAVLRELVATSFKSYAMGEQVG